MFTQYRLQLTKNVAKLSKKLGIVIKKFQTNQSGLKKIFGMKRKKFPMTMKTYGKKLLNGKKFQMSSTIG